MITPHAIAWRKCCARPSPDFRFENVSLVEVVKQHREWMAPNTWFVAREYGTDLLARRRELKAAYLQTTYVFRQVRQAMRAVIDPQRHAFSIQTGSLYDTGVPGVPHFIYTDHTHLSNLASPFFDRRMLRSQAWIALERSIYHNAARVFTRSSDISADVVKHYGAPPEKVVCVRAGSNVTVPESFCPDNAGYSNRHVLFVGHDWERKGGPELLEAFQAVQQVYPDAHLTVAGCRPRIELPNCTVLGRVSLNDLLQHYARASLFCLPTKLEPFGIAFLEAMMCHLPIVATAIAAVPDMVVEGENGMLVPPGDSQALGRALIDMLSDPERLEKYGAAGYRRATENYTWTRVGERIRSEVLQFVSDPPCKA